MEGGVLQQWQCLKCEGGLEKDDLHLVGIENACFIASKGKL